jgi:colanic acid/amylovoran biosynthesis glycosyltransferase
MRNYLRPSETFIHTTLRFQQSVRPVVIAQRLQNLEQFPFEPTIELLPEAGIANRVIRRLRALGAGYPRTYRYRLVRELRKQQCAIVHAHFGWAGLDALRGSAEAGIPLVTTFYGRDLTSGGPYDRLFAGGALFFCEGPHMAEHLATIGCDPNKIRIVKIGLDLSQFPFSPPKRQCQPFVLLQTARFVEKKGVDLSIRAFAAVQSELPSAELWLVGDGALRQELELLVVSLGVSDRVRFLGALTHREYRKLLQNVDICLQPSRTSRDGDTEGGAPTVLLEMQASGIPVISTRHADIPAIVPFGDALAEEEDVEGLAERIMVLFEEPDAKRAARADAGRAYVEAEHDARKIAALIEGHYAEAQNTFPTNGS